MISQSPAAEAAAAAGSEIALIVSTGASDFDPSIPVTIPNLVGLQEEEALQRLTDLKLFAIRQSVYDPELPIDQIADQTPAGNATGHQGDIITLIINRGTQSEADDAESTEGN